MLVHGETYKFDARVGPSVELVEHFVAYAFCTRDSVSAIGREGLGDSFELQIRYMLAKFVFVALKYNGWEGLNAHALHEKAEPFKFAVKVQWQRLKRMVAQVERVAQVETPVVTAVVLVEMPVVTAVLERPGTAAGPEAVPLPLALGIRGEQRKREDELLVRYEQSHGSCPNTRLELSSLASVPLGTLDGMLSRARKRRKAAAALPESNWQHCHRVIGVGSMCCRSIRCAVFRLQSIWCAAYMLHTS